MKEYFLLILSVNWILLCIGLTEGCEMSLSESDVSELSEYQDSEGNQTIQFASFDTSEPKENSVFQKSSNEAFKTFETSEQDENSVFQESLLELEQGDILASSKHESKQHAIFNDSADISCIDLGKGEPSFYYQDSMRNQEIESDNSFVIQERLQQRKRKSYVFDVNNLSLIQNDVDVYDFVDDEPPPPIRAPLILSDLFEESSTISDKSEAISVISSALDTSGSSTSSMPFGHLEYEPPIIRTSTPRKTVINKEYRVKELSAKKTTPLAIKKALHNCGCFRNCTLQQFYTKKLVKSARQMYWNLERASRENWIYGKLEDFQTPNKSVTTFRLYGQKVCQKAWLMAYGISKSSFYRFKTRWINDSVHGTTKTKLNLSDIKQRAIIWLFEYIAKRGEKPPHQNEVWLPFGLRKKEIYSAYKNEQIIEFQTFVSCTTFYRTWKQFYRHVKIRSTNLFTKCTVCVKLDRLLQSQLDPAKRKEIFGEKQAHLHRIMLEKLAYYRRRTVARRRPDRYLSLIVDGMDQTKTSIPHFKDRKGKDIATTTPLKTHVTAIISHGTNQKFAFTDYYQYKHDSNLTLNVLLKCLWEISKGKPLPPVLYLQADNCFRENKNRFVLSFLELLVHRKIFYEVQLSFLPVGHTHEDIDQLFSVYADKLRHNNAMIIPELQSFLSNAKELDACYDVSGWLDPYIAGVKKHTKSNTFRYRLDESTNKVQVYYRKSASHLWKVLNNGFFKTDKDKISIYPSTQPNVLELSFAKLDIQDLKKSLEIWKSYMSTEEKSWWTNFLKSIEKLSKSRSVLLQQSRRGCCWRLKYFKSFDRAALDNVNIEAPLPQDLRRLLNEEQENPEIIINNC